MLAFSEWQEPLKKLPGFQRFRDDLAKVSFVTALSRIARKIPGNTLWNHRAQLTLPKQRISAYLQRDSEK